MSVLAATALRDLCGWKPGMFLESTGVEGAHGPPGGVVLRVDADSISVTSREGVWFDWSPKSKHGLPKLDSSANTGFWFTWFNAHLPGGSIGRHDSAKNWWAAVDGITGYGPDPGVAMLEVLCRWYARQDIMVCPEYLPASVGAWWEAEGRL